MNKLMTSEEEKKAIEYQRVFGGPTPDIPIAERPETIHYQMKWLENGKRDCVYLPNGSVDVDAKGFSELRTDKGLYIFNPTRISPQIIIDSEEKNKIGDLLGYGISEKPKFDDAIGAVVVRDPNGIEKQAVAVDLKHVESAWNAAAAVADKDDTVEFEHPMNVIEKRMIQ